MEGKINLFIAWGPTTKMGNSVIPKNIPFISYLKKFFDLITFHEFMSEN